MSINRVSLDGVMQSPGTPQADWAEAMQSGLRPARASKMVSNLGVIDGPFAETKEVIVRPDGINIRSNDTRGVQRCEGM